MDFVILGWKMASNYLEALGDFISAVLIHYKLQDFMGVTLMKWDLLSLAMLDYKLWNLANKA